MLIAIHSEWEKREVMVGNYFHAVSMVLVGYFFFYSQNISHRCRETFSRVMRLSIRRRAEEASGIGCIITG